MTERLKIEGASEFTGIPVGTLRFYRATNQGPRSYTVARRLWYDVADLEAWMEQEKLQSVRGGIQISELMAQEAPEIIDIPDPVH